MDLTPPGSPAEGHIYLNDPTGETITYYKSSKTATSATPGGKTKDFLSPEALLDYLASKPSKQTSANALSQTEMDIITDVAHSYGLKGIVDYIGPKSTGTPFVAILDKAGQRVFNIRKLSNKFFFNKIVYKPNVITGESESVLHQGEWNALVKAMHVQFAHFAKPTMTTPDKDADKLSMSEMSAITNLAGKHNFSTTQPLIHTGEPPSIVIQSSLGSPIWAVRKANEEYQIINAVSPQNWEIIDGYPTFSEMLVKLMGLLENYMKKPQAPEKMGSFEFSPQEANDIGNLASQFGYSTKGATMVLEPDKHQVAGIELVSPMDGKIVYHLHKDNGTYRIYKVFEGPTKTKTWDAWYSGENANAFFQQLTMYLNGHTPGEPAAAPPEHAGITSDEAQKIKETVDSYGEQFWTEYVKGSYGQNAYVEVFYKPDPNENSQILFSVGALGNYYQINGHDNKPEETAPSFNGIIARIHDRLASAGEQKEITPSELDEIINLTDQMGFDYTPPEGDEPHTFVDGDNIIEIKYNSAWYTVGGVFGPIYAKNVKTFVQWFKSAYMTGKVPETAEKLADNILKVLDSGGFLDKTKFTIVSDKKIYAIKALRAYIMQVTGGPCGLAKSKWAVEHLGEFLDYIKQHGLPNMDPDNDEFMTEFKSEPHQVSVPNKLMEEEREAIGKIVGQYAPALQYQFNDDGAYIFVTGVTSFKIVKQEDVYRVLADKDGEWAVQHQTSTFNELNDYLETMLEHISKALANSKLNQPLVKTQPSQDPEKLSVSEIAELKVLIKKFKLPMSTSYSKKLMEDKLQNKEAYSLTILDADHNTYIKITKKEGNYVISKGIGDAYYTLKRFDIFDHMLVYLDYFLNSYLMPMPEKTTVEKIADDQLNAIKELVTKYYPKAKIRRKYMASKGEGKVPYVSIDPTGTGTEDIAMSKTDDGAYKLFKVVKGEWYDISKTNTWEQIYDVLDKVLKGEDVEKEKYNPPVFDKDQFEWLETFMKTKKPGVLVKMWGNGVIGGYDPSNVINGENNPLFVIRFAPGSTQKRILQVQTEDGGMAADEYPFNTFEALSHFIVQNIEVVTQLLKGEVPEQGKLAIALANAEFAYKDKKKVSLDHGGTKNATIYENPKGERLYLFDDGSSRIWFKNPSGETYKSELKDVPDLLGWMASHYAPAV